ncbi:MAG: hypothetical protein CVU05_14455, partial [Bacteroidetes bacterium HGW-Bacteroidetes-21]
NIKNGKFTNISKESGFLSIENGFVYSLLEDDLGNIWIGTANGLFVYNMQKNKVETIIPPLKNDNLVIKALYDFSEQKIFAGTNKGLYSIEKNSRNYCEVSCCNAPVYSLCSSGNGELFAGTNQGIRCMQISPTGTHNDTLHPVYISGKNIRVNAMAYDKINEALWVATTDSGLYQYNSQWQLNKYQPETGLPYTLSTGKTISLLLDKSGVLWIGTVFDGVHFTNTRRKKFNPIVLKYFGSLLKSVTAVAQQGDRLWLGSVNGLYSLNTTDQTTSYFAENKQGKGPANGFISVLFVDSRNKLWIGSDGGLTCYDGKSFTYYVSSEDTTTVSDESVWGIDEDASGNIWIATWNGGLSRYSAKTGTFKRYKSLPGKQNSLTCNNLNTVLCDGKNHVWVGTWEHGLEMLDNSTGLWHHFTYDAANSKSLSHNIVLSLFEDKEGNVWAGTFGGGLNKYRPADSSFTRYTVKDGLSDNTVMGIEQDKAGNLWIFTMKGVSRLDPVKNTIRNYDVSDGLQSNEFSQNGIRHCNNGKILAAGAGGFNYFAPDSITDNYFEPPVYLSSLSINNNLINPFDTLYFPGKNLFTTDTLHLTWNQNNLSFSFIALHFANPQKIRYECMLENYDNEWINLGTNPTIRYTKLPPGTYRFLYRSTNCDGIMIKTPSEITLIIQTPFWLTWWFISLCILLGLFLIIFVIKFREKKLKHETELLEKKVKERTYEINQQKEEISAQRDEIEAQRDTVLKQNDKITRIHDDLTSSIRYALRIQQAMLPGLEIIEKSDFDYFLLYKPRDIVSGDFYWFTKIENNYVFAIADCTGHGVPGAFMSMLGIAFLKEIVQKEYITQPAIVLKRLRKEIVRSLKQNEDPNQKDGMDISLCTLNTETMMLQFAGANNTLYIIKNAAISHLPLAVDQDTPANCQPCLPAGRQPMANSYLEKLKADLSPGTATLEEVKGDKMPIGIHERMDPFALQEIQVSKGDCIYMMTDGFADQFGGPQGKKFKSKHLKELLLSNSQHPMSLQNEIVEKALLKWKGSLEQVDDITLMGIRI